MAAGVALSIRLTSSRRLFSWRYHRSRGPWRESSSSGILRPTFRDIHEASFVRFPATTESLDDVRRDPAAARRICTAIP